MKSSFAAVILAGSVGTIVLSSPALASSCLTDGEIDSAVGPAVRARAPIVDTSALPDLPLCSGLTLAQRIQRMRAEAFPEEATRAQAERQAIIAGEEQMTREITAIPAVERVTFPAAENRIIDAPTKELLRRTSPRRRTEGVRAAGPRRVRQVA